MATLFVLLWIFASLVYGDVFYLCEQSSFFAFDEGQMLFILQQPFGPFAVAGRFLLLLFHYPWLGGLVWAGMLTAITWFLIYLLALRGHWRCLALLPVAVFVGWMLSLGFNLFYQHEPSVVFSIPLPVFVVLGVLSLIKFFATRGRAPQPGQDSRQRANARLSLNVAALVVVAVMSICAYGPNQNVCLTCRMQRQMQHQDWNGMIETALRSRRPTRSIAAYHAIALVQTDQLCDRLFELRYSYADMHLHDRGGRYDSGTNYYQADCDFYTGLLCTAYHFAMERIVTDGPSVYLLRRMALCAMLNGEKNLAYKYLTILSSVPFERDFVDKVHPLVANYEAVIQNPEYKCVLDQVPVRNTFEQAFQTPIFIGYNIRLATGRSMTALHTALGACLYAKESNEFVLHTQPLAGTNALAKNVSDAIAMLQPTDPRLQKMFPQDQWGLTQLNTFLMAAQPYVKDRKAGAEKLFKNFHNYYPYYYYFENLPEDSLHADHQGGKGGVN